MHPIDIISDRTATADNLSPRDFEQLRALVRAECGIHLAPEKRTMLEVRIRKRVRSLNLGSLAEYAAYVLSQPGRQHEMRQFIDAVTTNKTDFFRESRHFDFLVTTALPTLAAQSGAGTERPFLGWSAGCSTGEEPYTLAMVLSEYAGRHSGFRFRLLATDISTRVLDQARRAVYGEEAIEKIPPELRRKYLLRSRDPSAQLCRIVSGLRATIEFRRLNFMDRDFNIPEPFDVIFCRNVLIYFERETQAALLRRFSERLAPGGYLFLGHSETLHGLDVALVQADPTVYRRPDGPGRG
jgi:chemotaxis protein methyltransferase CheR